MTKLNFDRSNRAKAIKYAEKLKVAQTFDAGGGWTGWAVWNQRLGKVQTHVERNGTTV